MILNIIYCEVPYGEHLFATPKPFKSEVIECDTWKDLNHYITTQKDAYGAYYKLNPNRKKKHDVTSKYRYLTNIGGIIVEHYTAPKIVTIKKV